MWENAYVCVCVHVIKQIIFNGLKNVEGKFTFLFGHKNKIMIVKPR